MECKRRSLVRCRGSSIRPDTQAVSSLSEELMGVFQVRIRSALKVMDIDTKKQMRG